jgi:hypothetical protein
MRFCLSFRLSLFSYSAQCGFAFAITVLALPTGRLDAVQSGQDYQATQFRGYGSLAAARPAQNFATSRPMEADSTGSNYQSMSPDSWGSSAPAQGDPFASSAPTNSTTNRAIAGFGSGPATSNPAPSFSTQYGAPPATDYQYESTGAPSMETLLGTQRSQVPRKTAPVAPPSPYRPAEFDLQDPKDIPLAPTIPSSILDRNNKRLDLKTPGAIDQTLPLEQGDSAITENANPLFVPEPQPTKLPETQELATPFAATPSNALPSATEDFNSAGSSANSAYPQTTAQPFVPMTGGTPPGYQMPEVFETVPADSVTTTQPADSTVVNGSDGFGWGDAPGLLQRGTRSPGLLHQSAVQPAQAGPQLQTAFPLPFGMNSNMIGRGFGKRFFSRKRDQDPAQARQPHGRFGKTPDPNTYPPQPMPHSNSGFIPSDMPNAQFRPDLAQRSPLPTVRNSGTYDSGHTQYDFEDKKTQYPPFSEILATGRWFGGIEGQFVKPRFNGNSGIVILDQSGGFDFVDSQVFDFDFEFIPNFRFGFESKYGPGFEVDYRNLRTASVVQSFTSGANTSASLNASLPDMNVGSQIATSAAGQTLSGAHTLNFESFGFSVFKEVQLPITRINGMFGFQAVDIDHQVDATVVDGAGLVLQNLNTRSDMRAFGPRIRLEYYRPVGHTPLEFVTQAGGSLMFGKRDQFILGPGTDSFQRVGADEIVSSFEFLTALQIKQRIGENRSVYGRVGYLNQTFNSGGSGFLAQDDFGLRGVTFMVGVNR